MASSSSSHHFPALETCNISDEKSLSQAFVLAAGRFGTELDDGRFQTLFAYFGAVCKNKDGSCSARCANGRDDGGRTALHYMAMKGLKEFVVQLLDLGADPNLQDGQGQTPYHLALKEKHAEIALLLLERDETNVNIQDAFGRLATHWACLGGFDEVLSLAIAKGADVNAVTQSGDTALHWAAAEGHLSCVKVLIANGALPSLRNLRGMTALEVTKDKTIANCIATACQSPDVAFGVADEKKSSSAFPVAPAAAALAVAAAPAAATSADVSDMVVEPPCGSCTCPHAAAKAGAKKKPVQKKINITLKK